MSHTQGEMKSTRYLQSFLISQALRRKKCCLQAKLTSDTASRSAFLLLSLCRKSRLRRVFPLYQVSVHGTVPSPLSSFSKWRVPGSHWARWFGGFLTWSRNLSPRFSGYSVCPLQKFYIQSMLCLIACYVAFLWHHKHTQHFANRP